MDEEESQRDRRNFEGDPNFPLFFIFSSSEFYSSGTVTKRIQGESECGRAGADERRRGRVSCKFGKSEKFPIFSKNSDII